MGKHPALLIVGIAMFAIVGGWFGYLHLKFIDPQSSTGRRIQAALTAGDCRIPNSNGARGSLLDEAAGQLACLTGRDIANVPGATPRTRLTASLRATWAKPLSRSEASTSSIGRRRRSDPSSELPANS